MIEPTGKRAAAASTVLALWIAAACASTPSPADEGPPAVLARIPHFAADDPRIGTAGFVAHTLRLHRDVGERRFTLMAFAVDDALTLGAMVRGPYRGDVRWTVGGHTMAFHFDTDGSFREVPVEVDRGASAALTGRGATFRGTAWVNVDVPTHWLPPGGYLALEFTPADGELIVLPEVGESYHAAYVEPAADAAPTSPRS